YVTSRSITDLHAVRHTGAGAIVRGSNTFYVCPTDSQVNRLHVSASGSATNDGLSLSQGMATPQNAFDALANYGPVLNGSWRVIIGAGEYNVHTQTHSTPSKKQVIIAGPNESGHPNVPTAIIDGTGVTSYQQGMRIHGVGVQAIVQDIKFQNFASGGNNNLGLVCEQGATLYANNVHADNCDWAGIYCFEASWFRIQGGILSNCRSGFI